VKLALNQIKLPAGTGVPLKFDELVAVATHGGGGDGVEQLRVLGEKVISWGPLSPTVTVPDTETLPVKAPTLVVTLPVKLPLLSTVMGIVPLNIWPFTITL
jgi:hypothetical protein